MRAIKDSGAANSDDSNFILKAIEDDLDEMTLELFDAVGPVGDPVPTTWSALTE